MSEKPTFGQLSIEQDTVAQLAAHGITEPTPVQAQAIPVIAAK